MWNGIVFPAVMVSLFQKDVIHIFSFGFSCNSLLVCVWKFLCFVQSCYCGACMSVTGTKCGEYRPNRFAERSGTVPAYCRVYTKVDSVRFPDNSIARDRLHAQRSVNGWHPTPSMASKLSLSNSVSVSESPVQQLKSLYLHLMVTFVGN